MAELNEPVAVDCDDPEELVRALLALQPAGLVPGLFDLFGMLRL